jgi:hypothetical protein
LGSNIVVQYSVGLIITLHDRITALEYVVRLGNQVQPMMKTLFPNNEAVFQDVSAPIYTAGTVSHGLKSMKMSFSISLASTTTRFEHHQTTQVCFGDYSQQQIPTSNFCKAT